MVAMVVVYFHQFYVICSEYVGQEESFKAKAWKRICTRLLPSDKLSTRIHQLFVSNLTTTPIGGMIVKVKSILQLQLHLVCNVNEKNVVIVENGPQPQPQPLKQLIFEGPLKEQHIPQHRMKGFIYSTHTGGLAT